MANSNVIKVQNIDIAIVTFKENDYICLTDIAN